MPDPTPNLRSVIGRIPYRLALAGGWIDQPFVSRLNPKPPGSMVVVAVEPTFRFMDRSGIATGTREVAVRLWRGRLPNRKPELLVRELYEAENRGKAEPSGSQDMIGLICPGINRLDYDFAVNGGVFPSHIESLNDARIAHWLEQVIHVLPVAPRPEGYNPLGERHLDPKWIARLGQSGKDCFESIRRQDVDALGASINECMVCWEKLLPHTVRHRTITVDLKALLLAYQSQYPGAMYSGCGGGYLFVVSNKSVTGALKVSIRMSNEASKSGTAVGPKERNDQTDDNVSVGPKGRDNKAQGDAPGCILTSPLGLKWRPGQTFLWHLARRTKSIVPRATPRG